MMGFPGTLWSKIRRQLHGVWLVGRWNGSPPVQLDKPRPPLRILSCGLSTHESDRFQEALTEGAGVAQLAFLDPEKKAEQDIVSLAGKHDVLVLGEAALSADDEAIFRTVIANHPELPVLVVLPESKSDAACASLAQGATGYLLTNEMSDTMVRAAIAEVLREKKLEIEIRRLEEDRHRPQSRDRLTGLLDAELAVELFESEFCSAVRTKSDISCTITRISRLDGLVQSHGHAFADLLVRNIASLLVRTVRHADILTRIHPNEFLLVLPDTTLAQACQRAHQVLGILNAHQLTLYPPALDVSVHIGVASRKESVASCADDLIRFARKVVPDDASASAQPSVSVWTSMKPLSDDTDSGPPDS